MSKFTLIIGNKNISSWSLRGYLAIKQAGVDFDEILIPLRPQMDREKLDALTPAGKVPTIKHNGKYIWDSLAIGEYFNELFPEKLFWPADLEIRAHARCVAAEMHSGFAALRSMMPMAIHSKFDCPEITGDLQKDIERIKQIWTECREQYSDKGPYLFGSYCIADMMYAPVVFRFLSYGVDLPKPLAEYCQVITEHPDMKQWINDADPNDLA